MERILSWFLAHFITYLYLDFAIPWCEHRLFYKRAVVSKQVPVPVPVPVPIRRSIPPSLTFTDEVFSIR